MDDTPGQVATKRDTGYSLTIDEAAALYARAGHPRTLRTVQRYCASGHLDCIKEATTLGDKYFVDPDSVARHIAQIEELITLETRTSNRDLSRPAAPNVAEQSSHVVPRPEEITANAASPSVAGARAADQAEAAKTEPDNTRQSATSAHIASRPPATADADTSRYVAQLEREVDRLTEDRAFMREQIKTKDTHIAALLERDRETNILVGSLHKLLAPLLGPSRNEPQKEAEQSSL